MKYFLISIKDRAVDAFMPVGVVRAEGEALRVFKDLINDPQQPQSKHPADYDLYHVGYFDDQTGLITPFLDGDKIAGPKKIADGKTMREMAES